MRLRTVLFGMLVIGGCAGAPEESRTTQLVISDAATGGTAGFYFLSPLVDPPTYSGVFDGSYKSRLTIDLVEVDCTGAGQTGAVVHTFTTVQVYPTSEQYKVVFNVGNLGLLTGQCYRVTPNLDGTALGFRDVIVTSSTTVPSGYRKWGPGTNQQIPFRIEDLDTDDDTVLNHVDNCPSAANTDQADSDADGIGDACDVLDTDGDGVADGSDNCVSVPNADQADGDGDGTGDLCDSCSNDPANDADGDGLCGDVDLCPADPANDADGDGLCGDVDACPADPANDADGDGLCGDVDACPNDAANDADGDGICGDVDACPADPDNDADGDGICGDVDACPADPTNDMDGDGICGGVDACPADPDNDADGDGICGDVDACPADPDNDADGDAVCGDVDACPNDAANDTDGDGICGDVDNCPSVANADQADSDTNGVGDACELPCATVSGGIGAWTGDDTTADSVGTAHGAFFGSAPGAFGPAVVGNGFAFPGTNYVEAPFAYTGAFTVSLWARANVIQNKSFGLVGSAEPGTNQFADTFQIEWGPNATYRLHAGQGTLFVNIGATSVGAFQHIVVTYDGSTGVSTYLDGAPVATGTWSGATLAFQVLKIGANRGENNRYNGTIDDVRVFSRALNATEIASIHAAGADGVCH